MAQVIYKGAVATLVQRGRTRSWVREDGAESDVEVLNANLAFLDAPVQEGAAPMVTRIPAARKAKPVDPRRLRKDLRHLAVARTPRQTGDPNPRRLRVKG